jgi:hypothetical protein
MTAYILIAFVLAIALALLPKAMNRYPRLYCAVHGHEPRCTIENCGVMKFYCENCKQECKE